MWIARDKDGTLILFNNKPIKDEESGIWITINEDQSLIDQQWHIIKKEWFPEVKWEDNMPIEVELVIK